MIKRIEQIVKRMIAAVPELTLAWACYVGARDALGGEPPGLYLLGLVAIEIVSIAWLRLVMAPMLIGRSTSLLRTLIGIGTTGASLLILLINGITLFMMFLFVMLIDPRSFVLLLLALTRRSLWIWSWGLRSMENAVKLSEHTRRVTRVHYLAIALALATALLANYFFPVDAETQETFTNALWLAGMCGYFVALAIYMIFGQTPLPEEEKSTAVSYFPPVPVLDLAGLLKKGVARWTDFVPGILLTWFVLEVVWALVPPEGAAISSPIGIAFSGWALVGGACATLGITDKSPWKYGLSKAAGFGYPLGILWLMTIFLFFFSVPLVYGVLGLEIDSKTETTPAMIIGFVVFMMGVFYTLVRLWPICIISFVEKGGFPSSPFKTVWRLTSGIQAFIYGAVPPVLALVAIVFVMIVSADFPVPGKLIIYCFLAPATALIATERVQTMVNAQQKTVPRPRPAASGIAPPCEPDDTVSKRFPSGIAPAVNHLAEKILKQMHTEPEFIYNDTWTPEEVFLSAVYNQDIPTMQKQLDDGVSVDSKSDGDVALLWAARLNKPVSVRFLLDHGGDVYGRSITGATILHNAAAHSTMVPFLPELKSWWETVDVADNYGKTPLMSAVLRGCAPAARKLLELGADPLATDNEGSSVIHHFVDGLYGFRKNNINPDNLLLLRELLDRGVDPLLTGAYGKHAVSIAGRKGLRPVLNIFREYGVDLSRPDGTGLSAVSAAAVSGEFDTVDDIEKQGDAIDFISAVCTGRTDEVKEHILSQPDALNEAIGEYQTPPISLAIYHGQQDMVTLLIEMGANVGIRDPYGGSVLHNAVRRLPETSLIKQLINAGANVNAMDGDANTPLNFAAREDNLEIAESLLENGADPNAETERGYPVIQFARSDAMRNLLISYGARTK